MPTLRIAWLTLILANTTMAAAPLDFVLHGGIIIDGTGAPALSADVGLRAGRISAIGDLSKTATVRRIDVTGLVVSPGFIDVHNHADEDVIFPAYRLAPGMLHQGVTTAVFGVDGGLDLASFRSLKAQLSESGVGVNFAAYIGHNGIRSKVIGMADRAPLPAELERMKADVRSAMDEGALGLSTGLMYLPGRYATTAEVVELATATAPYAGLYDSHDRDPAFHLLDSVNECLTIAHRSGLEAHVAHLKAVGLRNAGKTADLIRLINTARSRGETVTTDVYPYDGATTRLVAEILVPPSGSTLENDLQRLEDSATNESSRARIITDLVSHWRQALSDRAQRARIRSLTEHPPAGVFSWVNTVGYDSFRIIRSDSPALKGRMVVDLAAERNTTPFDLLADLLAAQGAQIKLTVGAIREDDVRALLLQPWAMISSDGREGGLAGGQGHPRYRGSFARVLAYYVRDLHLLTLEGAIHKMSGLPAAYLKLSDRGVLRAGAAADVVVFDRQKVQDRSTWEDPAPYATGIRYVFINGNIVLDAGEITGVAAGRFLPFRNRSAAIADASKVH